MKLDYNGQVENKTDKAEPNFKNIKEYAINGAVHYANAAPKTPLPIKTI